MFREQVAGWRPGKSRPTDDGSAAAETLANVNSSGSTANEAGSPAPAPAAETEPPGTRDGQPPAGSSQAAEEERRRQQLLTYDASHPDDVTRQPSQDDTEARQQALADAATRERAAQILAANAAQLERDQSTFLASEAVRLAQERERVPEVGLYNCPPQFCSFLCLHIIMDYCSFAFLFGPNILNPGALDGSE